ncbi:MAG: aspartate/glutamate racemase family protein [Burkholderiaceae bacterium]
MRRLLVINPNTSVQVSERLQHHVQASVGDRAIVQTVTARFGAPYIADEASYAIAAHAALDIWAASLVRQGPPPDSILLGCFGDPGLMALRESSPVPVTGLAEAAFMAAARHGRFAIVTGGQRWDPMLQRLARTLGHGQQLAGIHTVAPTGAELAADPPGAHRLLAQACRDAALRLDVQAVILGGAGLAGMASAIQSQVPVPVIDSVIAGATQALRDDNPSPDRHTPGFDIVWQGLSPEMTALCPAGL